MQKIYQKYQRAFGISLLIPYLFLVAVTIFHYHHVDIRAGNYGISNSTAQGNDSPFDKLIDLSHNCSVQQFSGTVLNFTYVVSYNTEKNKFVQSVSIIQNEKLILQTDSKDNSLRAPPLS